MDLIKFAGSLVAIVIAALFAAYMFRRRPKTLSRERVAKAFLRAHPNYSVTDVEDALDQLLIFISLDGRTALVRPRTHEAGIATLAVIALGDRVVTRTITADHLQSLNGLQSERGTITLRLGDFTAPTVQLKYGPDNLDMLEAVIEDTSPHQKQADHAPHQDHATPQTENAHA